MKKIKIIHIVESMPVGGLEKTVYMIIKDIDKTKFDVELWCLAGIGFFADKLRDEGYTIQVLGLVSYHNLKNVIALIRKIRKERPDIIHTHGYFAGIFGRLSVLFSFRKIRMIHHYQTIFAEFYTKSNAFLEKFFNSITSRIICVSDFVEKSYYEKELIKPQKTVVIYNCAEIGKYKPRNILGGEKVRITIVASLREVKGHKYLIEAFEMLFDSKKNVELHIFGAGPLEKDIRDKVAGYDIAKSVYFRGEIDNVSEELSKMDIFVLSSVREGLPLSLVEAMASGLACVATDVGGVSEVIDNNETGLLVPPRDPKAIYNALKFLIENPEQAREMGTNARAKAEKMFDCKIMVEKIENVYKEVMRI